MPNSLTIPKNPVYPPSMDFPRLRREGIRHLERLGSAIVTDFNDHEAGITMLEVLDYAITDLGYRTHWPAGDLFALPPGRKPYPTAAEILTNGPVTALDLRKLLLDLEGVRNAWVECQPPPEVIIRLSDGENQQLVASQISDVNTLDNNLFTPRGVYSILLEIEDANEEDSAELKRRALARLHSCRNLCEDIDPVIQLLDTEPIGLCVTFEFAPEADPDAVLAAVLDAVENYLAPPVRFYTLQERLDKYGRFQLSTAALLRLTDAALPAQALTALQALANQEIVNKQRFLDAVRLAVGDAPFANYEALIFYHADKRYDSHPVYQGPLLDHGFLDETELEAAQLRRVIYRSDLYQLMLAVPGVTGILNLEMGRCQHPDNGPHTLEIAGWCLSFDCTCVPRLDAECSAFHYAVGSSYVRLDAKRAAQQARYLQPTISVVRRDELDLPVPKAQFRADFQDYTSVQEDFPQTYHIGRDGLASNETALRKAQVKQLKGYLLFYDQLLANYLAQLAKVRDLLAVDGAANYPAGFLSLVDIVPNVKPLELLLNYGLDEPPADPAAAEHFRSIMLGNVLDQQLYQSHLLDHLLARFGEQFTDYVLSLYSSDKLLDDGDLVGNGLTAWLAAKQNLLTNLPRLGSERARGFDYQAPPQLENAHIWTPREARQPATPFANVEGLKQRVCAQLGIPDASRHTISCEPEFVTEVFLSPETRARRFRFGVKLQAQDPMFVLVSTAWFGKQALADKARLEFEDLSLDTTCYGVVNEPDTDHQAVVAFWGQPGDAGARTYDNALLRSPKAYSPTEAADRKARFTKMVEETCQDDSFHLVEHLLLRPRNDHFTPLLTPLVVVAGTDNAWVDPYSFRLSVIVPDWVERYQNEQQYYLFSQTLRLEAPAHIALSFCRYNRNQMLAFETAYYNWLVELSFEKADPENLARVTNELVALLNFNQDQCQSSTPQKQPVPSCTPQPQ